MASSKKNLPIYLDNNATTSLCRPAAKAIVDYMDCPNPATDSKYAAPVKEELRRAREYIANHMNISLNDYSIIFTSGATESNCFIIRATVRAFRRHIKENNMNYLPHIVTSSIEHWSIIECLNNLVEYGEAEVTFLRVNYGGQVSPSDVEAAIKPGITCLVTIMYANNEIPVINKIKEIGKITHEKNIAFHTDSVQIFGKVKINMTANNISALSASAHKFYGPKGVGLLILSNKLIEGYKLHAEISGHQQDGLRGGTENPAGIISMYKAIADTFVDRVEKNKHLSSLRKLLFEKLRERFTVIQYHDYMQKNSDKNAIFIISFGPPQDNPFSLINTAFLSIVKLRGKPFCNVELKQYLDKNGIIISIGSACNTSSPDSSHVLRALQAPREVQRGVIRISFGDKNKNSDVTELVKYIISGVKIQCGDIIK